MPERNAERHDDACRVGPRRRFHGPREYPAGPVRHNWNRRARTRFFRLLAFIAIVLVLLLVSGAYALGSLMTQRFGLAGWAVGAPILLLLVIGGLALVSVRRFTWPLGQVMEAADRVASGDYTVRVNEYGPPAMRALAQSFNTMTGRLQHADRLRRDLMADLAHELRTPLSVLQGRLEGMIDEVYPSDIVQLTRLLDETHVLSRLVDDLRTLALSDAGAIVLQKETADAFALAGDVVRSFEADADRAGVSLRLADLPSDATLEFDPVRMREVLSNLVSNAIRHTPAGGSVVVSVLDRHDAVVLTVQDTGTGLAPDDLDRVFDRFYKGHESRGSGLGLTIARSLARAHGGDITASSELGIGTTMTVTVPRT